MNDDDKNQWQTKLYNYCQQKFSAAKIAVDKSYKDELNIAVEAFNKIDIKVRNIRKRKIVDNEDPDLIPATILHDWMEKKVDLDYLRYQIQNKALTLPIDSIKHVRKIEHNLYRIVLIDDAGLRIEKKC